MKPCCKLDRLETELARRRKGDSERVKIARRLRQVTTMTLKWFAQQLQMGTWMYDFKGPVQQ